MSNNRNNEYLADFLSIIKELNDSPDLVSNILEENNIDQKQVTLEAEILAQNFFAIQQEKIENEHERLLLEETEKHLGHPLQDHKLPSSVKENLNSQKTEAKPKSKKKLREPAKIISMPSYPDKKIINFAKNRADIYIGITYKKCWKIATIFFVIAVASWFIIPNSSTKLANLENSRTSEVMEPTGFLISVKYNTPNLLKDTNTLNNVTSYTYDRYGNSKTATTPLEKRATYEYDGLNRMIETNYPLSNTQESNGNINPHSLVRISGLIFKKHPESTQHLEITSRPDNKIPNVGISEIRGRSTCQPLALWNDESTGTRYNIDSDGTISSYVWTKMAGLSSKTIETPNTTITVVNNLTHDYNSPKNPFISDSNLIIKAHKNPIMGSGFGIASTLWNTSGQFIDGVKFQENQNAVSLDFKRTLPEKIIWSNKTYENEFLFSKNWANRSICSNIQLENKCTSDFVNRKINLNAFVSLTWMWETRTGKLISLSDMPKELTTRIYALQVGKDTISQNLRVIDMAETRRSKNQTNRQ